MPTQQREAEEDPVRLYLNDIGRHALLTKADEERLARIIEAGRTAASQLDGDSPTPNRRRQLQSLVAAADRATGEFVQANLRLVVSIAKRYQGSDLSLMDLVQEGNLGLIHAVEKFDYRKGFKFSTYATWWIRQAITRGMDNTGRTIRLPAHAGEMVGRVLKATAYLHAELARTPTTAEVAAEVGLRADQVLEVLGWAATPVSISQPLREDGDVTLADVVADTTAACPAEAAVVSAMPAEVARLLRRLRPREREILWLRFGLDRGVPRTLEEVGEHVHLTRERVRQIESRALSKLRHPSLGNEAHPHGRDWRCLPPEEGGTPWS